MKKKLLSTLFLVLAALTAEAQVDLIGSWTGKLDLGVGKLTLVFHLKQADGRVNVTMDSPDQSANGIPCSNAERHVAAAGAHQEYGGT